MNDKTFSLRLPELVDAAARQQADSARRSVADHLRGLIMQQDQVARLSEHCGCPEPVVRLYISLAETLTPTLWSSPEGKALREWHQQVFAFTHGRRGPDDANDVPCNLFTDGLPQVLREHARLYLGLE